MIHLFVCITKNALKFNLASFKFQNLTILCIDNFKSRKINFAQNCMCGSIAQFSGSILKLHKSHGPPEILFYAAEQFLDLLHLSAAFSVAANHHLQKTVSFELN